MTLFWSVARYYEQGSQPFPQGEYVVILDTAENLNSLSPGEIGSMRDKGVVMLDSIDNTLALSVASFDELGSIGLASDDRVTVWGSASQINALSSTKIHQYGQRGIAVIDAPGANNLIDFTYSQALNVYMSTRTEMAEDDTVTVRGSEFNFSADEVARLSARHFDFLGSNDPTNMNLIVGAMAAKAIAGSTLQMEAASNVTVRGDHYSLAALSGEDIRQLGLKNVDFILAINEGFLDLSVEQAIGLAETTSLSLVDSNIGSLVDTAANIATLTADHIASLDAKKVDKIDLLQHVGLLSLSADQSAALAKTSSLTVSSALTVTMADTAAKISAALATLTEAQISGLTSKGIDAIDATDDGMIGLSLARLDWVAGAGLLGSNDFALTDTGENLENLGDQDLQRLVNLRVARLDSTTDTLTLNLAKVNKLGSVGFTAEDKVTIKDTVTAIQAMDSGLILLLGAHEADVIDADGTQASVSFSAEQVGALAATLLVMAADDIVTLRDEGASIASTLSALTVDQLQTLAGKGIDAVDAVGAGSYALSLAKLGALGSISLAVDDVVTLTDTGAAIAALTSSQLTNLSTKGIDNIDASDDTLALSMAQLDALGSIGLTASDTVTVSEAGAALSGLSVTQLAALAAKGVDVIDAVDNKMSLTLAQFNALGSLKTAADDRLEVSGTSGIDIVSGRDANEAFFGLTGNDVIRGGLGNDTLAGGVGKDTLTGDGGQDRFLFDTKLNAKTNLDKVSDWTNGEDKFLLDDAIFKKLGKGVPAGKALSKKFFSFGVKDKNDYISYNAKTGKVSYDADGSGTKYKAIDFLQLKKGLTAKVLDASDFLIV